MIVTEPQIHSLNEFGYVFILPATLPDFMTIQEFCGMKFCAVPYTKFVPEVNSESKADKERGRKLKLKLNEATRFHTDYKMDHDDAKQLLRHWLQINICDSIFRIQLPVVNLWFISKTEYDVVNFVVYNLLFSLCSNVMFIKMLCHGWTLGLWR